MHAYRTHTCAELTKSHVDAAVRLSGWVHRKRDHGNLLFVDLRDHYGITQCVLDVDADAFKAVEAIRSESVVTITGKVVARSPETVNADLPTGEIEVWIKDFEVQSATGDLPMPVFGEQEYPEDIRLRHRYLDLRRETMHKNIVLRSQIIRSIRRRMEDQGFMEFQTPILTASSPEGARDFLVPSRLHPGKFYALPQAPQQFKQLIMVSGFDRYFQIAPCFRDEDARADRSPGEFYQLDVEMAFVTQDDVFAAIEPVMAGLFKEFTDRPVTDTPFPRIPYREAMLKYGTDKPDLRNPLVIEDVTEVFRDGGFGLFAKLIDKGAVVRAIPAPGAGANPRSFFDKMNDWARSEGHAGLGYINIKDGVPGGPIAKNLGEERLAQLREQMGLGDNDGVFFAAGAEADAAALAGAARTKVGEDLGLIDAERYAFCWIVDFPMYEYDPDTKTLDFSHNPFSMPQGGLDALETKDPLDILAYQYDIVCNGIELSSGAIRNHRPDIMYKAFEIAGYSPEVLEERFSGMLNAFKCGAPPHGGIAPGVDRIVMLLADEPNIREVILFPMNQRAEDLMMGAPNTVDLKHLRELHIRVVEPPKKTAAPSE
ncbi:aspartyl-tRNA synthetase [Rhodothalassium salexigens DSM 2132]|uniref:Aspartate--tRNA(Asp/Asn) ligase n=1 Tax=Rhodothalassium salexigens DSM 2132 TaxID=1188247 RepID=A0A4R2PSZ4_RHOSA|nr:aspartate--tRNA ligase [Rhodothalassium salexigens]MBB4210069.1 aspartyl-tRNA synthetase [Rhodothalassium salexigens DSM 2132]MBK1639571.1 aspartate--tRNA ligase [Rhodothalassium salexigens DSM 2132]TCP38234.1 aspartyl-tRNA synthetase [Rhodothalassium salexigens DSM 2132]